MVKADFETKSVKFDVAGELAEASEILAPLPVTVISCCEYIIFVQSNSNSPINVRVKFFISG